MNPKTHTLMLSRTQSLALDNWAISSPELPATNGNASWESLGVSVELLCSKGGPSLLKLKAKSPERYTYPVFGILQENKIKSGRVLRHKLSSVKFHSSPGAKQSSAHLSTGKGTCDKPGLSPVLKHGSHNATTPGHKEKVNYWSSQPAAFAAAAPLNLFMIWNCEKNTRKYEVQIQL